MGPPGVTEAAGVLVGAKRVAWQLPQFEFHSKPGVTVPQPTGSERGQFRLNVPTWVLVGNMGIKVGVVVACKDACADLVPGTSKSRANKHKDNKTAGQIRIRIDHREANRSYD